MTEIDGFVSTSAWGTNPYTTPAFTPPDNSLLVIRVSRWRTFGSGSADIGDVTITDSLGTPLDYQFISRVYLTSDAPSSSSWYYAEVGMAESMTITVDDDTNESMGSWHVHVWAFEFYNTDTPIAGATNSGTTNISSDGDTRTLTEAPEADDYVLSGLQLDCDGLVADPNYGLFTESYETVAASGYGVVCSSWRTGSTDTACVITDVYTSGSTFYKASASALIVKAGEAPQAARPDADVTTTGWSSTPLYSKINEASPDGTVITATAS